MKTLNQERAIFALKKVRKIKETDEKQRLDKDTDLKKKEKKFATYARRLPALIVTNGLLPTLAFLEAKEDSKEVYRAVAEWLEDRRYISNKEKALEELAEANFAKLRLATAEALALANWLKRIVEVEIKED